MECPKCRQNLDKVMTQQGVVIDYCKSCKGVWLDKGEIFMFSKKPKYLHEALAQGLKNSHPTEHTCPACQDTKLLEGGFVKPDLLIDQCPKCQGLWFDDGELTQALELGSKTFNLHVTQDKHGVFAIGNKETDALRWKEDRDAMVETQKRRKLDALRVGLMALPNLALRSTFSFVFLYGGLFFILIVAAELGNFSYWFSLPIAAGFLLLQYLIGPWIMDMMLNWLYTMKWVGLKELPEHLGKFIKEVCEKQHIATPKIGIIDDLHPNAFTYGRSPNDSRVVITRGILKYLEPDEVEAVVAHEIGHVCHWDILVMMLAAMVPLLLYNIYRTLMQSKRSHRGKESGVTFVIAIVAYILYIITEYIVLWLSRTREYWADRFAGEMTKNPNALARALVKIAYGLVTKKEGEPEAPAQGSTSEVKEGNLEAINVFGIFDTRSAKALALNAYTYQVAQNKGQQPVSNEQVTAAMQWDMWNPWALYYELHSTHPLPAKRLDALSNQAATMSQEPYLVFNRRQPESYWDEFLVDIFIYFLPFYSLLWFAVYPIVAHHYYWKNVPGRLFGIFCILLAGLYLLKTLFCYRGTVFPEMNVASLVSKVKVSEVRPVPVTLKGKIIGKGVPGYIFSEDMVLQDQTGIIFLDYRQPLAIFELFFALLRTGDYIGKEVIVEGWYRRAPTPFVEIKKLTVLSPNIPKQEHQCYVYVAKIVFTFVLAAFGIWLMSVK